MSTAPPKRSILSGLGESFLAVLLGNIIYFSAAPYLPPGMQHQLFRIDGGLPVDFLLCAIMLGLIRLVRTRLLNTKE